MLEKILIKNTLLLPVLLFTVTLSAQDWKPINHTEKYNYRYANNTFATLWVDSVRIDNTDSILILNTILGKLNVQPPISWIFGSYLMDQPQFFLSRMIYRNNGDIIMEGDNGRKYLLRTKGNLYDSWVFDSVYQDTATITQQYTTALFGNTDSIKVISLSNNDSIVLSKNFGILTFPLFDSVNQQVELAGIEGRNAGLQIPKFFEFFDINIGDIFYYKYYYNDRWVSTTTYKKFVINNIEEGGLTVSHHADYKSRRISHSNYNLYPDDTTLRSNPDSVLIYTNNANHFLNKYAYQVLNNGVQGEMFKPVIIGTNSTFNTITKSYPYYNYCHYWDSDTIIETSYPLICSNFNYKQEIYGRNVGFIHSSWCHNNGTPYPETESEDLVGCIINGVTSGTLLNDSIFMSTSVIEIPLPTQFNLFPNPAFTLINIEIPQGSKCNTLIISVFNGNEVLIQELLKEKNQLDISLLAPGLYFVKLVNDNSVQVKKIVKQ